MNIKKATARVAFSHDTYGLKTAVGLSLVLDAAFTVYMAVFNFFFAGFAYFGDFNVKVEVLTG